MSRLRPGSGWIGVRRRTHVFGQVGGADPAPAAAASHVSRRRSSSRRRYPLRRLRGRVELQPADPVTGGQSFNEILTHLDRGPRWSGLTRRSSSTSARQGLPRHRRPRPAVIVAGLDMDFRGVPFGPMPELLALAEEVQKITAICSRCGAQQYAESKKMQRQGPYCYWGAIAGEVEQVPAKSPFSSGGIQVDLRRTRMA